jgi:nondiscriminating glutamyl-tRNA synthetase
MPNSTDQQQIRVRFAPSPTGYLHVGGARTAIFNWAFARRRGGVFVLRIEDTDVERSTRESEQSLIEDLRWLGLDWDEGPAKGGPYGPYRQSERLELYRTVAEALVLKGRAYPCFCSEEELDKKREATAARGKATHYDGTCRELRDDEVEANRAAGRAEVIRFKVDPGIVTVPDLIRGKVELSTDMVGDFILIRSNGLPTYNFAVAVDDLNMKISHVLRGEEHLPNTLRQVLVYQALGAEPPAFGHVSLILAEDRSKLSKRHGASSIGELRAAGFLPHAVVNYLALLGWSHSEEKEVLTLDELVQDFALERVSKSAAIFDMKKLHWMGGMHIRNFRPEELFETAELFLPDDIRKAYDQNELHSIFALLQERTECYSQLAQSSRIFLKPPVLDDDAKSCLNSPVSQKVVTALAAALENVEGDLSPDGFKDIIKQVGQNMAVKGKELYFPVRAAVTGNVHGPDIATVVSIRGKDDVIDTLNQGAGWYDGSGE